MRDVYYFGAFAFMVFGFAYAVWGFIRGDCRFSRSSVYSDSAVTRAASGIAVGAIWPVFVPAALLWSIISYFAKKKGRSRPPENNARDVT